MEIIIATIGLVGLILLVISYGTLSKAFVAYKFYYWFIVPYFIGIPNFSFYPFVGFTLFLSIIMPSYTSKTIKDEYAKDNMKYVIGLALSPWMLLVIGWIFKQFI